MPGHLMLRSIAIATLAIGAAGQQPWQVLADGTDRTAAQLNPVRKLSDAYHPWTPPTTLAEWRDQARALREQILISAGLWPMPPRAPLEPVVHGKVERDGYTIEKVYFASLPGHYVTGSLYRPKGISGTVPGVLCPHGHSHNGRMHDAGNKKAREQLVKGAEDTMAAARHPLQACMVQLVRMGCVVFHHDMVGYASSRPISHASGFTDAAALLRSQSTLRLQTWNSIRALDFLLSLPEVDQNRIAVTGHSGGGTQTFMLGAIDERPTAAFPAVMVSTAMQGGCVCENAPYLRHDINNVAIAALFAPRPLALSGANDWTIDIETRGLPELQSIYELFGAKPNVTARCWPEYGHNYNLHARQMMYGWFNRHLGLSQPAPVKERDFVPLTRAELEVFDAHHPLPDDAGSAADVRAHWDLTLRGSLAELLPLDRTGIGRYRDIVRPAARVLLAAGADQRETAGDVQSTDELDGIAVTRILVRPESGRAVPLIRLTAGPTDRAVLWVDGDGKRAMFDEDGQLIPAVRELVESGAAVASIDVLGTGESTPTDRRFEPPHQGYAGYTYCYNRPLIAQRVRDIVKAINQLSTTQIDLVGTGGAGPWVLLALASTQREVRHTLVDLQGFSFSGIEAADDPDLLPGALAFGGLGGLAALAAPARITVLGTEGLPAGDLRPLEVISRLTGGDLTLEEGALRAEEVPARLR